MFKSLIKAKKFLSYKTNSLNAVKNKVFFSNSINADSFANGTSAGYVESMYKAWLSDPKSVHISWDAYFQAIEKGVDPSYAFVVPPTILPCIIH